MKNSDKYSQNTSDISWTNCAHKKRLKSASFALSKPVEDQKREKVHFTLKSNRNEWLAMDCS